MIILKQYERLVEDVRNAVKSMGWSLVVRQDIDEMLYLVIDDCEYFVSPTAGSTESFPLYYLGVMVPNPGTRHEPPSCDDKEIASGFQHPQQLLGALLDAHYGVRKDWAMQSTITYGED